MLTRCYEATSYLSVVDSDKRIQEMREEIYFALKDKYGLEKSKKIFEKFGELYEEKVNPKIIKKYINSLHPLSYKTIKFSV